MQRTDGYEVRSYEPADRAAVLSLYEETFGPRSEEWFEWRYVENPYLSHVPIHVVERDDEVVAARPSLPIPLDVAGRRELAVMQPDPMVHPDHRRKGLFTRMASHVHDRYAAGEPTIEFGFPNERALDALEKLTSKLSLDTGVRYEFPEYFRVGNPSAMVEASTDDARIRTAAKLAAPAAVGYLRLRDALAPDGDDYQLEREDGVPTARLAALAAERTPDGVHAARDEAFYRWRFDNPRYVYRTYLARRDGDDVVAVVIGRDGHDTGADVANVTDVVPLTGGSERDRAVSVLLERAFDDISVDGVAAGGAVLDRGALARLGFQSRGDPPLSLVSGTNYVLARPLTESPGDEWVVGGRRLTDPSNWQFTYCEREIG